MLRLCLCIQMFDRAKDVRKVHGHGHFIYTDNDIVNERRGDAHLRYRPFFQNSVSVIRC
jgi:hypothetical protein